MDGLIDIDDNIMCSDSEIEAFFGATSNENIDNDVILKKEAILVDGHEPEFGAGAGGEWRLSTPETAVPKPLERLYEEGPTPFLKKTYAMVDDPLTNSIISWSESQMSFVIWDHHKFSGDILPKNFKHCNFSSFVRQLNTYGFKKLSPDRWEYANEGFQKGKDYLLKNIKRKKYQSDHQVLQDEKSSQLSLSSEKLGKEAELKKLESDTDKLRMELLNIQKEQESADNYLLSVKERLRRTEQKQLQMFIYMAKAFKNPLFSVILMQQLRPKEALDTAGNSKKQKLIAPQCNKRPVEATDYTGRSQVQDGFATIDSEMQKAFSSNETRSPVVQCQKVNEVFATKTSDVTLDNCLLLENLLTDDVVSETKAATEQANIQSKVVLKLEELITKASASWDVSMKEMVEQAVCLQSQF